MGEGGGAGGFGSSRRVTGLTAASLAAVGATAVVFLSEDPQVLRVAVVAVAWVCLLAAFAAARPAERERSDGERSGRERSEHARQDAADAVRGELDALRGEVAGLRAALSGLDALHREVAAVGAAHADLHADLRCGLAELGALRADVGRVHAELAGQPVGETRVAGPPPEGPSAPGPRDQPTVQQSAVHATAAGHAGATASHRSPAAGAPGDPGAARLAQILAEGGVAPGGRRHRHRDG